ncbi:MAG: DUF6027 family protein [Actinomycetota bacterium]
MSDIDPRGTFRDAVELSKKVDPMPTFEALARSTSLPVDSIVHHALVRWVSAGSEALMALDSLALEELVAARKREDWQAVAGIIDWLDAGRRGEGYR